MSTDTPDRLAAALRAIVDAYDVLDGFEDDAVVDALGGLGCVPDDVAVGSSRVGSAAARVAASALDADTDLPSCSFCLRGRSTLAFVIQGPGVAICDRCVGTCNTILAKHGGGPQARDPRPGAFVRLAKWLAR